MRVRGLKRPRTLLLCMCTYVAPHAGAWIETDDRTGLPVGQQVAPHAGAWIETQQVYQRDNIHAGRTPCGCVD